jgi:hypothetical protein
MIDPTMRNVVDERAAWVRLWMRLYYFVLIPALMLWVFLGD